MKNLVFIIIVINIIFSSTCFSAEETVFDYTQGQIRNTDESWSMEGGLFDIRSDIIWKLAGVKKGYYKICCRLRFKPYSGFDYEKNGKAGVRIHNLDSYRLIVPGRAKLVNDSSTLSVGFINTNIDKIEKSNGGRYFADVWADGIFYLEEGMEISVKIIDGRQKVVRSLTLQALDSIPEDEKTELLLSMDEKFHHFSTNRARLFMHIVNFGKNKILLPYQINYKHYDSAEVKRLFFSAEIPAMAAFSGYHEIPVDKFGPYVLECRTEKTGKQIFFSCYPSKTAADLKTDNSFGSHFPDLDIFDNTGGMKWVRTHLIRKIEWANINPQKDVYNWAELDQVVDFFSKQGLSILYSINDTPEWLRPDDVPKNKNGRMIFDFLPKDMAMYDAFIERIAERYKDRINYWEVWNEPNTWIRFNGTTDDYLNMLERTYKILKKIDTNNQVIAGAIAPSYAEWAAKIINQDQGKHFDILSIHPYANRSTPEAAEILRTVSEVKTLLTEKAPQARLWSSEIGYFIPPRSGCKPLDEIELTELFADPDAVSFYPQNNWHNPMPERTAASWLVRNWLLNFLGGSEKIIHFKFYHETEQAGAFAPDGSYRLTYLALMVLANRLDAVRSAVRIDTGDPEIYLAAINQEQKNSVLVAWTCNTRRDILIPVQANDLPRWRKEKITIC